MPLRLFLVRHGESVDNVAGLLAGIRDSPLTSHGVLQARRLGAHLAARDIGPISHIFASNLQRAVKTAEAIAEAQPAVDGAKPTLVVTQLVELREKNFGSDEGMRFVKRASPTAQAQQASSAADYVAPESQDAMQLRVQQFITENLVQAISQAGADTRGDVSIVVVAHGIILNVLLRCLLNGWGPTEFARLPGAGDAPERREWLASWSNTGYLESEVRVMPTPVATSSSIEVEPGRPGQPSSSASSEDAAPTLRKAALDGPPLPDAQIAPPEPSKAVDIQLSVKRVNCVEHLQGLKKTRGGIGSAGFDEKQKTMDSFFRPAKKPKHDDADQ